MKTAIFTSSSKDHEKYNGKVSITRPLTSKGENRETDPEAGPMFRCKTESGEEFDAFADELSEV